MISLFKTIPEGWRRSAGPVGGNLYTTREWRVVETDYLGAKIVSFSRLDLQAPSLEEEWDLVALLRDDLAWTRLEPGLMKIPGSAPNVKFLGRPHG